MSAELIPPNPKKSSIRPSLKNFKPILSAFLQHSLDLNALSSQLRISHEYIPLEIPFNILSLTQFNEGLQLFEELILSNYKKFLKLLNQICFELLCKNYAFLGVPKPDFLFERTLSCSPSFQNFPFLESPLRDYEFKLHIIHSKNGQLIHLRSIQVLKIYPQECFLWLQHFNRDCDCRAEQETGPSFYLKHCFLEVLKNNYNDLKAVMRKKLMVCEACGTPYKEAEQGRVFLNCQKVEAFFPEISKKTHLWLLDRFLNKLSPGMRFNGVCYYDVNTEFAVQNSRYLGVFREYFVLVSANLYVSLLNRPFFEDLALITPIKVQETGLYGEWVALKSICNRSVGGDLLPDDCLMGLRFSLLISVINKNKDFLQFYSNERRPMVKPQQNSGEFLSISDENNIHVFIIGESEGLLLRTILEFGWRLENFGIWPYCSDENSIYDFLLQMQNGIIFIPDAGARLRKNELYLINKILRREEIELANKEKLVLNVTLWFYGCPNIRPKPGKDKEAIIWTINDIIQLESFNNIDLVIDISRRNSVNKRLKHSRLDFKAADLMVNRFHGMDEFEKPLGQKSIVLRRDFETSVKGFLPEVKHLRPEYHEENCSSSSLLKDQPLKLMQAYFKTARKAKFYSITNYNSFRKICSALSLIRSFFLACSASSCKIEPIDVIIGIMLDELSTGNKIKETEAVNSVVFGTIKGSKIGGFWLDCEADAQKEDEELLKEDFPETRKEKEKKAFIEIYQEILDLCSRAYE